ncbi:MAG: LptF/LptG family permease [Cyanobacteria bacterium P01_E01_bin.35]
MKLNCQKIKHSFQISILDRYLVRQLSWFFCFSFSLFTSLGVAIGNVADLAEKFAEYQLPLEVAVLIFGYKIPEYAAYALPISILLTGLVVYSRLQSDRELVALFSFGISFYRLILVTLLFSFVITGITFLLNELIVPAANYQANLLQNPFIPRTELNLQKRDIYYGEYESSPDLDTTKKLKHIYFAEQYAQSRLQGITILAFEEQRISQIITAQSAQWNQIQRVWDLSRGIIYRLNAANDFREEFTAKQLLLPKTVFEIINRERSPQDMNIRQAQEYLSLIEDNGKPTDIAKFAVRIQQKYAFPFICIVFALIGSALGAKYGQLNRAKSFGLCVVIVFSYYCLGFGFGSLGITGIISPVWAAWLPNAIALITGGYLLITINH